MSDCLSNETSIPMAKWTSIDSQMQQRLVLPPLRDVLTPAELSEVERMGRFVVGQRVRAETPKRLDGMYRIARKEWKRLHGNIDAHDKWAEQCDTSNS